MRNRRFPFYSLLLILLVLLTGHSLVSAQDTGAALSGDVKDHEGLPLPGVAVTAESTSGAAAPKNTYTDAKGNFLLPGLAPGTYDITVELSGFVTITQTDIQLNAGDNAHSFVMKTSSVAELVVVTASRIETPLINAPATLSVIGSDTIEASPAQNYADLLRSVPGLNITQTSARDINLTSRQATSTLATSQLALLDGRSIYLDFFGFVAWDWLPVNFDEIKQIEVIRGPASAVWGANAQTGVVNIVTKSPRETPGTSIVISGGVFDRDVEDALPIQELDSGTNFATNVRYAQAINDSWAYKFSAGYFTMDELARPVGRVPVGTYPGTTIPTGGALYASVPYQNEGTDQPKIDFRLDQDLGEETRITYSGGWAGTSGIIHTGIGPFDINNGSYLGYGKFGYGKGNFKLDFFVNILDADSESLFTRGADGKLLPFDFKSQTYDFSAAHSVVVADKNILSFGGNYRRNNFELEIAPEGDDRNELGAYFQEEFFTDKFRLVAGIRVDKFSVIDEPAFSPRVTGMYKPTPSQAFRASYNRAFRAPSQINNFLNTSVLFGALNLSPFLGRPVIFPIITPAVGNENLLVESLSAYEIGYTGEFDGRTTVSFSYYINDTDDNINFVPTGIYSSSNLPPFWAASGLPAFLYDLAIASGAVVAGQAPFPDNFTYLNIGPLRQQGIEVGFDTVVNDSISVFANYSWQDTPEIREPDADELRYPVTELSIPPENRFNAGINFNSRRYLGSFAINYTGEAFWTDVLTAPFQGATDAFTSVNCAFGVRWMDDHITTTLKVNNLFNEQIQQHIFGDIMKRSFVGEVRFDF